MERESGFFKHIEKVAGTGEGEARKGRGQRAWTARSKRRGTDWIGSPTHQISDLHSGKLPYQATYERSMKLQSRKGWEDMQELFIVMVMNQDIDALQPHNLYNGCSSLGFVGAGAGSSATFLEGGGGKNQNSYSGNDETSSLDHKDVIAVNPMRSLQSCSSLCESSYVGGDSLVCQRDARCSLNSCYSWVADSSHVGELLVGMLPVLPAAMDVKFYQSDLGWSLIARCSDNLSYDGNRWFVVATNQRTTYSSTLLLAEEIWLSSVHVGGRLKVSCEGYSYQVRMSVEE
eukprot:Gb_15049 [translate_table: standard]